MNESLAGYREIEHTADWELACWATDLPALLEQAARGMYALSETQLAPGPRQVIEIDLPAADPESLLVAFLSELLWLADQERLGFDTFQITIQADRMAARMEGAPVESQTKTIKAATYHNLKIVQTRWWVEASVVFDV